MIKEALRKLGNRLANRPTEEYGDMETRDNYLRSLRRERRIQLEQYEKKRLKAQIEKFNKEQRKKNLWGYRENILKSKNKFKPDNKQKWL